MLLMEQPVTAIFIGEIEIGNESSVCMETKVQSIFANNFENN